MNEVESADTNRFAMISQHLEATFRKDYPACKAYPFGSTVTGLAFKGSDMDIYMDLSKYYISSFQYPCRRFYSEED